MDAAAKAAIEGPAFAPAYFIWLDIAGDPLRVTTFGDDATFSGTGDSDLDGNTFIAFGGSLLDVGNVSNSESGSETLTVTLSGVIDMDPTLMNEIGNKGLWQGRTARIWCQLYDESGTKAQGAVFPLYTGYMSSVGFKAAPEGTTITLNIENYLAFFSQASNRSYLNQKDYDSADNSAAATITSANGLKRGGHGAVPGSGSNVIGGGVGAPGVSAGGLGGAYGALGGDGVVNTAVNSK